LSNPRVEKIDNDNVRVSLEYEFSIAPNPKKFYTLLLKGGGVNLQLVVKQAQGKDWPKRGQVAEEMSKAGIGTTKTFWFTILEAGDASDATTGSPISTMVATSLTTGKKDAGKDPPAGPQTLEITKAKVTPGAKGKGIVIEVN